MALFLLGCGYSGLSIVPNNADLLKYVLLNTAFEDSKAFAKKVFEGEIQVGVSGRAMIKKVALDTFPLETINALELVEAQLGLGEHNR
jgi:signal transduction protein with GAF and PtsI domain